MKLWYITQGVNNKYDTYDSAVVAAETEQEARETSPSPYYTYRDGKWWYQYQSEPEKVQDHHESWTTPDYVSVQYLGEAESRIAAGVICASFNAG